MSNIVRAVFGGSKTTRTRRLWKIDRGMLLQFVDLNLPTAYQVHFANTPASGQAKVVTATSDTVEIPYEYLQTGADVYAWVYLTPENGVGYTEYMVTIPVYARPDVTDEEPTPAQQSALDTAISALNSGVQSVQAAVAGVQDSIDTALQEAKDSGEFDGADGYTPVKGVDYFDGADGYSPVATVTQTATGATVTVTDKTGTTTAEISNGQDGATFTPAVSAEGVISWTNDGGETNPQPVNIKGPQGDDYILTATDKEEISQRVAVSLEPALDEKAPSIYCKASGAIASFTDGADNLPVQDLVVQIEPVQAGSGDPSPDNVRPITGWTGAKVTRTGKNLMDLSSLMGGSYDSVSTFPSGNITTNAFIPLKGGFDYCWSQKRYPTAGGRYIRWYNKDFEQLGIQNLYSASATICHAPDDAAYARFMWYQPSPNMWQSVQEIADDEPMFELGSTATAYKPYQGTTYDIAFPTEAGTVYGGSLDVTTGVLTVDMESMVFDGTQAVGLANWRPNETSVGWLYQHDVAPNAWNDHRLEPAELDYIKSDKLKTVVYGGSEGLYGIGTPAISIVSELWGIGMRINDTSLTTATAINAYLAQNPITVVYKLATPQTYQLTPTEVRTLLGQNNIWADTGDTAVTYRADTKLFVEQNAPESPVQDVQVNGVSVLQDGVANVPVAGTSELGVVKIDEGYGISIASSSYGSPNALRINKAADSHVKAGNSDTRPIVTSNQHRATFYGLAKAAGSDMASVSSTTVGVYTESAKSAISEMLNGSVIVSGTTPTINALPGIRYICGEVTTIDITTPASGIVDVVFTSGSTQAVLTVTPPTGMTMKWANGFDPDNLEADTTYEINIADGCLGVAGTWS